MSSPTETAHKDAASAGQILQRSLTKMLEDGHASPYYRAVHAEVLNPKSITMGELYGEINLLTLEWRDGVLGRLVRAAVSVGDGT